jgi:hypothetical protein
MIRETLQFCGLYVCAESKMKYARISTESNVLIAGVKASEGVMIRRGRNEIKGLEMVADKGFILDVSSLVDEDMKTELKEMILEVLEMGG